MARQAVSLLLLLLHATFVLTRAANETENVATAEPTQAPPTSPPSNQRGAIIVIGAACLLLICIIALIAWGACGLQLDRASTTSMKQDLSAIFNHSFINYASVVDEEVDDIGRTAKDIITVDNAVHGNDAKRATLETLPNGQKVIHALSPRLQRSVGNLLQLAEAYQAVLQEAIAAEKARPARRSPLVLRMEPLAQDYSDGLETLSFAALSLAYNELQPSELECGKNLRLQFCVPVPDDSEEESSEEEQGKRTSKKMGCCGKNRSAMFSSYSEALRMWQSTADEAPTGTGQLRKQRNQSWIREGKSDRDRVDRLGSFCQTRRASSIGAYGGGALNRCYGVFDCGENGASGHISTRGLIEKTQVVSALSLPRLPANPSRQTIVRGKPSKLVLDVAAEEIEANSRAKICVVSAAAGYQAGGGFTVGGRHALEEAMCTQSTLYQSLESVLEASMVAGLEVGKKPYFDPKSAILSPGVTVFREGSNSGYKFMEKPYMLNVVSIFMPNKNPQVHDAPLDAPRNPEEYKALVIGKLQAMLHAAVLGGSEVLVCPDVGCGVFGNNPAEVGQLVGEEMRKMWGYFSKIVLVGKSAFIDAAMQTLVPSQASLGEDDGESEESAQSQSDESHDEEGYLMC